MLRRTKKESAVPYPLGAVRALGGKTNVLLTISRTATVCPADVRCGSMLSKKGLRGPPNADSVV